MKNFAYLKAGSLAEASKALSAKGAWLHAGGTDLLGCAHNELLPIDTVVSISRLKQLKGIAALPDEGLKIGALTSLAEIASNAAIVAKYPALAQSAAAVGTPQIREQGTLGGNICQKPRCWYFRSDLKCLRKGGGTCYAMSGENQYHAIFGGGPCFFVHPSDTAVALAALQAQIAVSGISGSRTVRLENFFISPQKALDRENVLMPGDIITEIRIPAAAGTVKSAYRKVAPRGSWDFALASVGVALQFDKDVVNAARIVLGGVAPYPWQVEAAAKLLVGKKLDASQAAAAGDAAVVGARPLRDNAYKVELVRGAVEELLLALL